MALIKNLAILRTALSELHYYWFPDFRSGTCTAPTSQICMFAYVTINYMKLNVLACGRLKWNNIHIKFHQNSDSRSQLEIRRRTG